MAQFSIHNPNHHPVFLKNGSRITGFIKTSLIIILSFTLMARADAQKLLSKSITLTMPAVGGANSCAVVWHPKFKRYYTSMVGNEAFYMAVFDSKGTKISDSIPAGFDLRGMWYNSISDRIEFNCYNDGGWGHLALDKKGDIIGKVHNFEGMNQPDVQSAGIYKSKGNKVLFLNPDTYNIDTYNAENAKNEYTFINLFPGCYSAQDITVMEKEDLLDERWESRNLVIQYTGKKDKEIAVLNASERKIELYSEKTGLVTETLILPQSVVLQYNFNFSYSNGIWWIFDKTARKWEGFK